MGKAKIKHVRLNHIYDHYPLYLALYGQSAYDRARDAYEASIVSHVWVERFTPPTFMDRATGTLTEPLRVMELFSGSSSEHEAAFRHDLRMPIQTYGLSDVVRHPDTDPRVVVADITEPANKEMLARSGFFDVLLAFYFSGGSFLKNKHLSDPHSALGQMMRNAALMLRPGGLYVLDTTQNPIDAYMSSLIEPDTDGETERSVVLYSFHPMRAALGLPAVGGYCELFYKLENRANRVLALSEDRLFDIRVEFDGVTVARFSIKEPFIQVSFTEGEMVRSARAAGFDNFIFLGDLDSENGQYDVQLDEWLEPVGAATSYPNHYFATKIGFVKSGK